MKFPFALALVVSLGASAAFAQAPTTEKGKLSYAVGYEIGKDFNERKMDIDVQTVIKAIQDGYAKRNAQVPEAEMRAALEKMQTQMVAQAKAEFEKVSAENKRKSDGFMAQNRAKTGIKSLPSGVQYRVIEDGTGRTPNQSSNVKIHFRGALAATGQEFANTNSAPQPVEVKVSEAPLKGLQEVLPMMKAGSRWEVFMPAEQAYGNSPRSPIGPNQAVMFELRLVEVAG